MTIPDHPVIQQLTQVRHALLRLHKALLDGQRARYERTHGPVQSTGELLKLVIENPAFDWLHRVSELVVQIDEAMEDKETALTPEAARTFVDQVRALLTPDDSGHGFGRRYHEALQDDPVAAGIHAELKELMRRRI